MHHLWSFEGPELSLIPISSSRVTTWSLEALKACSLNYKIPVVGTTVPILCAAISVERDTQQVGECKGGQSARLSEQHSPPG